MTRSMCHGRLYSCRFDLRDFDALVELVKDKMVKSEGVILVEHAADGRVRATQTGDHLGRRGLGVGGGALKKPCTNTPRCKPPATERRLRGERVGGHEGKYGQMGTVPAALSGDRSSGTRCPRARRWASSPWLPPTDRVSRWEKEQLWARTRPSRRSTAWCGCQTGPS